MSGTTTLILNGMTILSIADPVITWTPGSPPYPTDPDYSQITVVTGARVGDSYAVGSFNNTTRTLTVVPNFFGNAPAPGDICVAGVGGG